MSDSGILAHCRWLLGTNLVEGINNKIKVVKRVTYGYRDVAYFFLENPWSLAPELDEEP